MTILLIGKANSAETNAKFFPQDSLWQKHCAKVAAYLNAISPLTSVACWDSRKDVHPDCLAVEKRS